MNKTSPLYKAIIKCEKKAVALVEVAERHYSFPEEFLGFQGHFPSYPVLPAVIQCCLGVETCSLLCNKSLSLIAISKAKYKQQVAPNTPIKVAATYRKKTAPEDLHFSIKITGDKGLVASFHLQLTETKNQT